MEHQQLGLVRGHEGNRTSYTAPSNMYLSRDGVYFSLVASSNPIFRRLCAALGEPAWADDPRYATNPARVKHLSSLDDSLAGWFAARDFADIAARLEAGAIPFSKVYSIQHTNPYTTVDNLQRTISLTYRDVTQFVSSSSNFSSKTLSFGPTWAYPVTE